MRVAELLDTESLDLTLNWGDDVLAAREVRGVTVTDLEDPRRFVRPGDLVLSGLVWWTPEHGRAKARRFVAALREAGAAALFAGEETHGTVPGAVADACREHGVLLARVPAHTDFRAITDAVYLRQWDAVGRGGRALPESTHRELDRLLAGRAPLAELLEHALASLGVAGQVVTATGRVLAGAAELENPRELPVEGGSSRYDAWRLRTPAEAPVPPRALHEVAAVLGRYRLREPGHRAAGDRLVSDVDARRTGSEAWRVWGRPGPYRVVSLVAEGAADALEEGLAWLGGNPPVVGTLPGGEAVGVVSGVDCPDELVRVWPRLHACAPEVPLAGGLSAPAAEIADLPGALDQARHAAAVAAQGTSRIVAAEEVTGLAGLLAGLPGPVRVLYREQVLGPLLRHDASSPALLLDTLENFLAANGSWTRTAELMHVHVNTVHYRIERVQQLTGRDLSRLDHRLDLRAALLCR
ncbi:helix-turn-helix domain-containing protein [Amycolatopsis sp. PS_44_ISF1]|uniref:helix-turn-helix domain-containing protein n=1 Tax=Amycolatopsis sp. PS_44_ISF1 TaxID=2974917 RepID=UPI0028DE741A|nr:helix-turn-helix domain-containing protein [Amycolatopsis sp. PS_44_ISF1]MDT8913860.1 PucR family transcriptional regulator [Amycolatopsis sp. PS_44_ISF1]